MKYRTEKIENTKMETNVESRNLRTEQAIEV